VPLTRPRRPGSLLARLARKFAKGLLTRDTRTQRWVRRICFLVLLYTPRRFWGQAFMRLERKVIFEWSAARRFLPRQNFSRLEAFLVGRARRRLAQAAGPDLAAPLLALSLYHFSYEILETADPTQPPFCNDGPLLWFLFRQPIFFPDHTQFRRALDFYVRLFADLDRLWRTDLDPVVRQLLSTSLAPSFSFISLLFSDINLRPLAVTAGRWVEHFLGTQGASLDHEFPEREAGRRVRLGVLARNVQPRTESFIAPAFTAHLDRTRFEPILVTLAPPVPSPFSSFLEGHFEKVVTVAEPGWRERAAAIRALDLDVLILGNTLAAQASDFHFLIAHRLARIQVLPSAIAPWTTGLSRTDYVLTSALTEPAEVAPHYSERVVLLEGSFNCFLFGPHDLRVAGASVDAADVHLPARPISFASGGSLYKLAPELIAVWARIMREVPESELILYPFSHNWGLDDMPPVTRALRQEFRKAGVSPSRLVILPSLRPVQLLKLLRHVTVYLDTFPYSGAASFIEPALAPCPAVTLRGTTQRGLQGAAMLTALGLEELVAASPEEYVRLVVSLARDPARRARIRDHMRSTADRADFLNPGVFGSRMERALETMLREQPWFAGWPGIDSGAAGKPAG
jgi:predicted O-linked N-acetylglucosamine transferase (SPINDLY family)